MMTRWRSVLVCIAAAVGMQVSCSGQILGRGPTNAVLGMDSAGRGYEWKTNIVSVEVLTNYVWTYGLVLETNGSLQRPTNFFAVNSNLLNQSIGPMNPAADSCLTNPTIFGKLWFLDVFYYEGDEAGVLRLKDAGDNVWVIYDTDTPKITFARIAEVPNIWLAMHTTPAAPDGTNYLVDFSGIANRYVVLTNNLNFSGSTNRIWNGSQNLSRSVIFTIYPNGTNRIITWPASWQCFSSNTFSSPFTLTNGRIARIVVEYMGMVDSETNVAVAGVAQ